MPLDNRTYISAVTGAAILLLEKVLTWLRHKVETDDSAIALLPLTPRYNAEKHGVYFAALERALLSREEPVLNVALTGSYGVGKSSILEELARRYSRKVIAISLSTLGFQGEAETQSGEVHESATKTNRIQKEIVKQLLYSQDPLKMPGSRYRRMTRFRFWRELGLSALIAIPLTLVFYLAGWSESLARLFPQPAEMTLLIHLFVFFPAVLLLLCFRFAFHNRIQIDKITAGSATISLSAKSATYFDEYLDEIVYFFEVVKRDLVIFEDIDRFDDAHIFETLRSLNSILNGAQQLKGRRIQFVYAIKDSIFDELGARAAKEELDTTESHSVAAGRKDAAEAEVARANRTKFFDLVIPVVPFITHRSARDLIVDTMKDVDHNISNELIDMAAGQVADMRLIKNIRNEFAIFKRQVIDPGHLALEQDKLFALMLYKSTHLTDFELIKLGKSNLDKLYQDGRGLVAANVKALNQGIRRARAAKSKVRISAERSEALGDALMKHIKISLFDLRSNVVHSYSLNQKQVTEADFRTAQFWDEISRVDGTLFITYGDANRNQRRLDISRSQIAEALGEPISSKEWVIAERARLDDEIRNAVADREFLTHADMSDLMSRSETLERGGKSLTFAHLAEQQLMSELALQLVAAGYIERNFTLYTSTFYGERISANATNFILKNIEPNVTDMFFALTSDDVDAIIREKGKAVLRERSAYNISILDRLLDQEAGAADTLGEQLMRYGEAEREFLLTYLEGGNKREALVRDLTTKWPKIFTVLISDAELDEPTSQILVDSALLSMTSDGEYVTNEAVRNYISHSYASLHAFTAEDTTQGQAARIAGLIKEAEVRLARIEPLGQNVREAIVAGGSYDVTRGNLRVALGHAHSLNLDAIAEANRAVYARVLVNLPDYLAALHEDQHTVLSTDLFIDIIKDVSGAAEGQLPEIISRAAESCRVTELANVPPAAWPSLAEGLRFPATFLNVQAYIDEYGLDASLARVLEDAGKIEANADVEEPAKLKVALTVLQAVKRIPSPQVRASLVGTLALKDYIPATTIPQESGQLIGYLIAEEIVADDAETFAMIKGEDLAGLAFAISMSSAFAGFMTPTEVTPSVVAALIRNDVIPDSVKDTILERFGEFTAGAGRDTLESVARYALRQEKLLPFSEVARLADEGVETSVVLALLQPHLPSLSLAQLSPVLNAIGGKYQELTEANGKRPSIEDSEAHRALIHRLRTLGVVSSVDQRGAQIRINMRRQP